MVQSAPTSSNGNNNPFTSVASSAASGTSTSGSTTAPVGTSSSSTEAPPSAAYSAYEYQQYVAGTNVSLGTQMAEAMGLQANSTYSGDDLIKQFETLPTSALIQVESFLYAAGFYASDVGEPLSTRVTLGGLNPDDFNAMSAAILAAANGGKSLTDVINNQITSGAAYLQQQAALQPVSGGGKTYQVNQTSPQDVYGTAMSVFEQYLGRFPTQQELAAYTAGYNQLSTQYQQAQNTQTENMSQTQYKAQISQRQAELTPAVPPANGSGNVPNGPFTNASQYAVAILEYMGATPSSNNVAMLTSWINANGGLHGQGQFNPLGVQATATGSTPGKNGAANYTSWAQGIMNAVGLLTSPQYSDLRATLMAGTSSLNSTASSELSQWTNGAVTSLKPTKTVLNQATQAVNNYVPQQPNAVANQSPSAVALNPAVTPPTPQSQGAPPFSPAGQSSAFPVISSQMKGGLTAPQQPNWSQEFANAAQPNNPGNAPATKPGVPFSASSIPVGQAASGSQGMTSPGDTYIPSSTLNATTPPSLTDYLTTQATTGANQLPYMVNQYLQAYQNIVGIIKGEF